MSSDSKIEAIPNLIRDPRARQYLPNTKIGTGGFASVWRAKVIDRRLPAEANECALKVIRTQINSKQLRTRFKFELGIHNKLHHPNIVQFYRAFNYQDLTYVSLELCENGSLADMVRKRRYLTMPEIRRSLIQLCGAVHYLHSREVVHRDIKAANVFLDAEMNVKLGDFGLAAPLEPSENDSREFQRRTTFCGTPNYLAPELLSRKGHDTGVDVWAIGILLYFLSVGAAPFTAKSKEEIYSRVKRADYVWPQPSPERDEIPQDLQDLVASILVPEESRPSPHQVVQHEFFTEGFIPERIESLARTRKPRWPKAQAGSEANGETYKSLCKRSGVWCSIRADGSRSVAPRRLRGLAGEPVLMSAAKELQDGIMLQVPLPAGVVINSYVHNSVPPTVIPSSASTAGRVFRETTGNAVKAPTLTRSRLKQTQLGS